MKKPARVNPESESDLKSKSDVPTPGPPSIADSSHTLNQEPTPGPQIEDPLFAEIDREKRERKATKSDDAEVPVYLWEEHLIDDGEFGWTTEDLPRLRPLIEACKTMMLRWWKRKVTSSFFKWVIKTNPDLELTKPQSVVKYSGSAFQWKDGTTSPRYKWFTSGKQLWFDNWRIWQQMCPRDIEAGVDAIARAARTTWWEWKDGSRYFHWRWPDEYIETVRDGLPVYFVRKPLKYTKAQQDIKEKEIKALVLAKLKKVRDRRYIAPGHVVGLICFFEVAKGDCDIRMVYNRSES
eukprot:scaffold14451_cov47-Attheya_sp.AAC.1